VACTLAVALAAGAVSEATVCVADDVGDALTAAAGSNGGCVDVTADCGIGADVDVMPYRSPEFGETVAGAAGGLDAARGASTLELVAPIGVMPYRSPAAWDEADPARLPEFVAVVVAVADGL
jgi:hypothetical protein